MANGGCPCLYKMRHNNRSILFKLEYEAVYSVRNQERS